MVRDRHVYPVPFVAQGVHRGLDPESVRPWGPECHNDVRPGRVEADVHVLRREEGPDEVGVRRTHDGVEEHRRVEPVERPGQEPRGLTTVPCEMAYLGRQEEPRVDLPSTMGACVTPTRCSPC